MKRDRIQRIKESLLKRGDTQIDEGSIAENLPEQEILVQSVCETMVPKLVAEDIPLSALQTQDEKVAIPPLVGALLKNEQDVTLFEKLVFMQSRNR